MTQQHPITPPPELVEQWCEQLFGCPDKPEIAAYELVRLGAQWGADQELEACCEWLKTKHWIEPEFADELHAERRPKPQSLKEQALSALENLNGECLLEGFECPEKMATIRRALEQLPDNEPPGNSR